MKSLCGVRGEKDPSYDHIRLTTDQRKQADKLWQSVRAPTWAVEEASKLPFTKGNLKIAGRRMFWTGQVGVNIMLGINPPANNEIVEMFSRMSQALLVVSKEPLPEDPTTVVTACAEMLTLYKRLYPAKEWALIFHALICLAKKVVSEREGLNGLVGLLGVIWERFLAYATRQARDKAKPEQSIAKSYMRMRGCWAIYHCFRSQGLFSAMDDTATGRRLRRELFDDDDPLNQVLEDGVRFPALNAKRGRIKCVPSERLAIQLREMIAEQCGYIPGHVWTISSHIHVRGKVVRTKDDEDRKRLKSMQSKVLCSLL